MSVHKTAQNAQPDADTRIDEILGNTHDHILYDPNCYTCDLLKEAHQAIKDLIAEQVAAAKQTIDTNTWLWISGFAKDCMCDACIEIRKQKNRKANQRSDNERI